MATRKKRSDPVASVKDKGATPATKPASSDEIPLTRLHVWQVQMVRDALVVGAVLAMFWAGYALRAVTVPLLVALLLAYLFEPVIEFMCARRKMRRPVAVAAVLAVIAGGFLLVLAIVAPLAWLQADTLVKDVQRGEMRERIAGFERFVPEFLDGHFEQLMESLPGEPRQGEDDLAGGDANASDANPGEDAAGPPAAGAPLNEAEVRAIVEREVAKRIDAGGVPSIAAEKPPEWGDLGRRLRMTVDAVVRVIGATVGVGLLLFLIPFYFFFFSVWYPAVVKFGRDLLPKKNRARTIELLSKMDHVIAGFVRGRIVISLIMGAMLAIGWMICGVPYAVLLGLVVGIFCAVPYLGAIGIPIAVGLSLVSGIGGEGAWWFWAILWPTVVFAIVQLIEGYVLTPMIAGKATNLDPVTILVAVLAGGSVLGIYGMLLAIPLAACAKILFIEVLLPDIRAWTRGEAADPLPIDRE